jgi:hypothetical protein
MLATNWRMKGRTAARAAVFRGPGSFKRKTHVAGPEVLTTEIAEGTEVEKVGVRFPDLSPWNGRRCRGR